MHVGDAHVAGFGAISRCKRMHVGDAHACRGCVVPGGSFGSSLSTVVAPPVGTRYMTPHLVYQIWHDSPTVRWWHSRPGGTRTAGAATVLRLWQRRADLLVVPNAANFRRLPGVHRAHACGGDIHQCGSYVGCMERTERHTTDRVACPCMASSWLGRGAGRGGGGVPLSGPGGAHSYENERSSPVWGSALGCAVM